MDVSKGSSLDDLSCIETASPTRNASAARRFQ
jgi:hypothetical protein